MEFIEVRSQKVPALGLGTWQVKGSECTQIVRDAIELGYRHIDTAQVYENEAEVGQGIHDSGVARDDLFVTTKVWRDSLDKKTVVESTKESLKKLKTDYVNLLLIHWPNDDYPIAETMAGLKELKDQGLTRLVGVSNFPTKNMKEAIEELPDLINNQVEYHPFLSQKAVLGFVREHGMFMTSYSPLARGKVFEEPVLTEIAKKHNKTEAQITLRWLLDQERVAAIPKTSKKAHAKTNLEVFDFQLSDEDRSKIDVLQSPQGRIIDPSFAPQWDAE